MPKNNNFNISFPGKILFKLKKMPPKNQTIFILYLLQAQPALALLLLACYRGSTIHNVQTEWQLCRPSPDQFALFVLNDLYENLGSLR